MFTAHALKGGKRKSFRVLQFIVSWFQGIRMEWKSVKDKSREKLHLISFAVHSLNANLVTTS